MGDSMLEQAGQQRALWVLQQMTDQRQHHDPAAAPGDVIAVQRVTLTVIATLYSLDDRKEPDPVGPKPVIDLRSAMLRIGFRPAWALHIIIFESVGTQLV